MADFAPTPANVVASTNALVATGIAAAAIVAGDLLAALANGTITQSDANGIGTLSIVVGVALHAASTGQPIRYVTQDPSFTPGFTSTIGVTVIASGTVGKMCPDADKTSSWFVTEIGHFISTTQMKLILVPVGVAIP